MPRFVVLEHDHPVLHWDFMLEAGRVLRTWRLAAPPQPGQRVPATSSFDHRLLYLDHEGPISGDRGSVKRWDTGTFTWERDAPTQLAVHLQGGRLRGRTLLEQSPAGDWSLLVTERVDGEAWRVKGGG